MICVRKVSLSLYKQCTTVDANTGTKIRKAHASLDHEFLCSAALSSVSTHTQAHNTSAVPSSFVSQNTSCCVCYATV